MKQREKCSGRGFDSRPVHQMKSWNGEFPPLNLWNHNLSWRWKLSSDGPDQVATGQRVTEWTAR